MASTTGRRPWQEIALRSAYSLVGVAIIGLGAAVMLVGGVGVDPFTALNTGISDLIGWSLGTWQLVANAIRPRLRGRGVEAVAPPVGAQVPQVGRGGERQQQ
ncbi:hypothetical protein ILP97_65560, partial [Amycolatopsis sp. H6(2020)]|nr:hypothetical protein [Amycolatopsis sp. H6(2020)]